ncbi:plasmid pRiA4b ORF-3 family protein [Arenimonas sp.]|uniref:plasmid pRiA4b ORF-3 family protein n=1 Tax=Arenimonas sp. TaxID=1872635 RepID=UPI0025C2BE5F|nr:plasmid pRiA4b ORF-3 family protein [Arenimonas sp.]
MPTQILQIRIELERIEPLIWRRIQVPGDYTFWDLHVAIQSAFAWTDTHLHEFRPCGQRDGTPRFGLPLDDFDDKPPLPCWEHCVADVLSRANPRIEYEYDFGDGWEHTVVLEEVLEAAPGKKYPRCTAGERSAPPDDCGGPGGYESLLETLADPGDPEYKSSHLWASSQKGQRGKFDPEAFDEQQVKFANPAPRLKRLLAHLASRT